MKAIVTGATKGIGRAVALKLASEGFDIAICARNEATLHQFKSQLTQQFPDINVFTKTTDVSEKKAIQAFADFATERLGTVDVLVNNAGVFIPGKISEEKDGVLEKMIETNLYSAYNLTRAILPGMMKRKKGHIFNICSIASFMAYPNGGSYSISKFAMLGMSKVLREEMKEHNIRVTAIMPGATYTASWEGSGLPEERFMKAEDVAETIWSCYRLSERTDVEEIILRPISGDI